MLLINLSCLCRVVSHRIDTYFIGAFFTYQYQVIVLLQVLDSKYVLNRAGLKEQNEYIWSKFMCGYLNDKSMYLLIFSLLRRWGDNWSTISKVWYTLLRPTLSGFWKARFFHVRINSCVGYPKAVVWFSMSRFGSSPNRKPSYEKSQTVGRG